MLKIATLYPPFTHTGYTLKKGTLQEANRKYNLFFVLTKLIAKSFEFISGKN